MVSKQETLKRIKQIVDARAKGLIKLKKPVVAMVEVGRSFKTNEPRTIKNIYKNGNSVWCTDTIHQGRNINELDTKALRIILWQFLTDKAKREIALDHLYTSYPELKEC